MHDESDDSIPPLDRPGVSPLWRAIAIVTLLGVAVLLCMIIVLIFSLAQQGVPAFQNNAIVPPLAAPPQGRVDAAEEQFDPAKVPYPLQQDLRPPGAFPLPGEAEQDDQRAGLSPRREFLKLALRPAVWSSTDAIPPESVLVSSDGANMAYVSGDYLIAGPLGAPAVIDPNAPVNGGGMMMGGPGAMRMAGGWAAAGITPPPQPRGDGPRSRLCGWTSDGKVYWSNSTGHILSYAPRAGNPQQTTLRAELALPLPFANAQQAPPHYLVLRPRLRPKTEGAVGDVRELLAVDSNDERRDYPGLKAMHRAEPQAFALSPDGKRVAVVARRADQEAMVYIAVLSLDKEGIIAATPNAPGYAGVCWTADGNAVIYARREVPAPPGHTPAIPEESCDLYLFDLGTKVEMRLSRGGQFSSPSTVNDDLFFLNRTSSGVNLEDVSLEKARKFAADQQTAERDRAAAWSELASAVFKDAEVAFAEDRTQLNAASIGKLADAFGKVYAAKFKEDAPATPAALDQERRNVASLSLAAPVRSRLRVVFGAVAGEYLHRHQKGSTWALGAHPVAVNEIVAVETPFGFATNPFQSALLGEILYRAEGRPVVLSDDAARAKEALGKMTDPDLARGSDLLQQGKDAEADRVLLDMVKRHGGNYALAVHVGTLLHQHACTKALAELAKPWLDQLDAQGGGLPRNARLYNLIGISALESNSDKAVLAFQTALRCDLDFGPAYLNLAQAYTKSGSADQVRQCLRRYLKLFPRGEWAEDARRRLAVEGENW
jgi:tetratricopeptide (TPR) repeat protein